MAITATIALSSSTIKSAQKTTATLTVSNSGGADVLVTGIQTLCMPSGQTVQSVAASSGVPPWGGGFPQTVAASGSTNFSWDVVPHAPTTSAGLAQGASYAYDIGAVVYTNDGSVTSPTVATVTVTNPAGL